MGSGGPANEEAVQREYYNRIAREYDAHYTNKHALAYRYGVYDLCLGDIDLSGMRALDAMCGGGEATGYLLQRGASVTGLDISDECCRIYGERFPGCHVVCKSIRDAEFQPASFDLVLTDSLHHLHPRVDEAIALIHRILKPNGLLCCWEPSRNSLIDLIRRGWYRLDKRYFQANERAIAVEDVLGRPRVFSPQRVIYGGSVAYVFVNLSMALRIPVSLVNVYAPFFMSAERVLNRVHPRFLSCWVLCLVVKQ